MKHLFTTAILFLFFLSCKKSDSPIQGGNENPGNQQIIPKTAINAFIREQLSQQQHFNWEMASDSMVWSALVQGDSILSVGYQPAGFTNLSQKIHLIDTKSSEWQSTRNQVLQLIMENERKNGRAATENSLLAFKENQLPVVDVKVSSFATVKALRESGIVRYAEPIGYGAFMQDKKTTPVVESSLSSGFGCGSNVAQTGLVVNVDYTNITPGAKQSWSHPYSKIGQAWAKSTGKGVKIMIIDTGVSSDQENLGTTFNQGASTGRTIEKKVTLPGATPVDNCGHGTSMAGAAAAPRGTDGASAGVAYNCNLVTVHAADGVVLLSADAATGVADAYMLGANDASVKIISMSMGTIFDITKVKDAIIYAHNKQKLMFCAAGTSFSVFAGFVGVIFPASLSQVVAVTGIKDNLTERCGDCHQGPKVDFVVVMEKVSNGRKPLSLAMSGDVPSTVGGSSVSTATVAGIAALVWAKYPADTRDAVYNRLKNAGSYANNRHANFGWGIIDADAAVGL